MSAQPDWRRLHPITPVLRSWRLLALLLALYAQQRGPELLSAADGAARPSGTELVVALVALGAAVACSVALTALSWRVTVYRIDAESVRLHSGLVFRRQRAARLDRVQAVDVLQPLLARLLGFAEVKIEVAGGAGSGIRLSYLREADAHRLRSELLAGSAGLTYTGPAPTAPERVVVEVPLGRLAASVLLCSTSMWLLGASAVLVVAAVLTHSLAPVAAAFPLVVALATATWGSFTRSGSWEVAVAGDGLRVRHGLLSTQTQTVLPGRVQAISIRQGLLWRPAGWWRVSANVAGSNHPGGRDGRQGEQHLLLPVATLPQAQEILGLLLPGVSADPALPGGLAAALTSSGSAGGWVTAPRRARWLDPVAWRRQGALMLAEAMLLRRGRVHRQLDVVPSGRTQSLALRQGPLQRRLHLASLAVHSTRGPVRPVVDHLDPADAVLLLGEASSRARAARARAGPERWMERRPAGTRDHAPP